MPGERVLVVDDNDAFRSLMATHLQRRGYDVESARDGLDALQVLRSKGVFAVLVTDLMMPNMSGLELIREVRKFDEHLQVVVITAAATLETAISAMRADGAYDYLLKPLEVIGELSVAVERAAAHRRLRLERQELQAKLALEAGRLQTLIAHTGDAILAGDSDGNLTVVNPAGARLLGKELWLGQPAAAALPEMLATLWRNWQSAGGRRPTQIEVTWSDERVLLVNLTALAEPDGRQGWVMVLRDVTHLRRLDDLRLRLLTEAATKIRFPLAQAVIALSELNDVPEAKTGRAGELTQRLVRLWDRIWQWMDSLLTLVQVESVGHVRLTDVDLTAVLTEVGQTQTAGRLRDKNVRLTVAPVADLPLVRADSELLRQLLNGLLARAAGRSEAGGEIRVAARAHERQVWVEVSDDGPEVSEADLPHIFERTYGEAGLSGEGTGLELALVKAIIERLGGQVWVGGQPRVGGAITVCLPAVSGSEAPSGG